MKKIYAGFLLSLLLSSTASLVYAENATPEAHHEVTLKSPLWPFDGFTGTVDRQAAQRGFQVYKNVCSTCHSLTHVSYRHLTQLGFSEAEVKSIAAEHTVRDGPNDDGEMFDRPAKPSDFFAPPYPNEQAARAANGGAYPPDQSLIVKAREDGPDYIYSLLTGYTDAPKDVVLGKNMYYNPYFPGGQISMPPPLSEGMVMYEDGTHASVDQMSRDVIEFLQWAAEPEMESRKRMGLKVMLYIAVCTLFFIVAKKKIWSKIQD